MSVGFEVGPLNTDYYTLLFYFNLRYIIATVFIYFDIFLLHVESIKTLTDTLLLHQEYSRGRFVTGPHRSQCAGGAFSAEHRDRGGYGTSQAMNLLTPTKLISYRILLIASSIDMVNANDNTTTNTKEPAKGEMISSSYLCVRSQTAEMFTTNDKLVMMAARTYRFITTYIHFHQTNPGELVNDDLEPTESELAAMEEDTTNSNAATETEEGAMTPDRPSLLPHGQLMSAPTPAESEFDKSSTRTIRQNLTSSLTIVTEQERKRRDSDNSERGERRKEKRQSQLDLKRGLLSAASPDPQPDVVAEPDPSPQAAPARLPGPEFDSSSAPDQTAKAPKSKSEPGPMPHHITNGGGTPGKDKELGADNQKSGGRDLPCPPKQAAGPDDEKTKNQKRKARRKQHDKLKKQKLVGGQEEKVEVVDDSLGPEDVFKKGDAIITLRITQQGRGSDAINDVARLLFLVSEQFTVTSMYTIPDGARIEVPDHDSAAIVQNVLEEAGWTVEASDVWARYVLTVPALLAGSGPGSSGLDPATLVRGLMLRNTGHGLPANSIRYMSHAWETVQVEDGAGPSSGSTRQRMRIWVDVSPGGETFLRGHAFLLETLISAVRLRRAPRSRHHQGKSKDEPGDD